MFPDLIYVNMKKYLAIIFVIIGVLLICVGVSIPELFFLFGIGVLILIVTLVLSFIGERR